MRNSTLLSFVLSVCAALAGLEALAQKGAGQDTFCLNWTDYHYSAQTPFEERSYALQTIEHIITGFDIYNEQVLEARKEKTYQDQVYDSKAKVASELIFLKGSIDFFIDQAPDFDTLKVELRKSLAFWFGDKDLETFLACTETESNCGPAHYIRSLLDSNYTFIKQTYRFSRLLNEGDMATMLLEPASNPSVPLNYSGKNKTGSWYEAIFVDNTVRTVKQLLYLALLEQYLLDNRLHRMNMDAALFPDKDE